MYTIPGRYTEVPRLPYYPPPTMYPSHGKQKNSKETGLPPAKRTCPDAGVTAKSTGYKKPDQATSHLIKKEPACTDNGVASMKPNVDALEPPDVKPNIVVQHGIKGSFISRVSKGSDRLLIKEYPTTKTLSKGGANTKSPVRSTTIPSKPGTIRN